MARIELDGVTKRFPDGTVAVRDACLEIADGEFFILVGPSGCGKSTLLAMIAGLEDVTAGEIRVDGRRVNEDDPKDRNLAMVFQSYALYPHMSVRENLAFPLRLAKRPSDEIERRVSEAARTLAIADLLDRRPAQLSGGQRQRVAMGRALVREPAAFLMDEPLSNLDAKLRAQMRAEIARLQSRLGTTTIYVTHDQTEAMTLGDRLAVLRRGAVEQVGTAPALYAEPANLFVAGFIGSPAMNFLPAEWDGERLALPVAELGLPEALRKALGLGSERRELVAGIRPEHLEDAERGGTHEGAARFEVRVELVEWMGSELHAHAELETHAPAALARLTEELEIQTPRGGAVRLVARLDATSRARQGQPLGLRLDPRRLHLFDPETGARLAAAPGGTG